MCEPSRSPYPYGEKSLKIHGFKVLICAIAIVFGFPGFGIASTPDSIQAMRLLLEKDISIEEKANYAEQLAKHYWYFEPDSALFFSRMALSLPLDDVSPKTRGMVYFTHGFTHTMHGNPDSVIFYLNKSRNVFREHKLEFLEFRVTEQLGNIYRELGRYSEAEVEINKAEAYFISSGNADQINSILINKGSLFYDQNRYNRALEYYTKAAAYDSILNDPSTTALTKLGMGAVYQSLGKLFKEINSAKSKHYFQTGLSFYSQSKDLFKEIDHLTGVCYCTMHQLSSYLSMDETAKADSIFNNCKKCLQSSDTRVLTSFMIYQAELLDRIGLADSALKVLDEVKKMKNQLIIPHVYQEGKFLKAKLLRKKGLNQQAHLLADTVINWFKENKQFALAFTAEREKSDWYFEESNFEQAYQKAIQANQLHDSIMAMIAQEIYDEVALKYENQLLSTKIDLMEAEAFINRSQLKIRNVLFLIYSLLLLSLILLMMWLRKREKLKNELLVNRSLQLEKENEHKKSQLEKAELERKLKEDELERFLLEAEVREQEMVFKSLRQANLVLLNKSIKERLGPFQFKFSRKKDQEAFVEELEALSREAARDPLSDFENMFTQMHSGFYEKLIELNPDFTRSELQMCALLRMNLPSKEIANVLSLSVSRVDQTRHQIRKKLELDQNQSLTSFLILI